MYIFLELERAMDSGFCPGYWEVTDKRHRVVFRTSRISQTVRDNEMHSGVGKLLRSVITYAVTWSITCTASTWSDSRVSEVV